MYSCPYSQREIKKFSTTTACSSTGWSPCPAPLRTPPASTSRSLWTPLSWGEDSLQLTSKTRYSLPYPRKLSGDCRVPIPNTPKRLCPNQLSPITRPKPIWLVPKWTNSMISKATDTKKVWNFSSLTGMSQPGADPSAPKDDVFTQF